MITLCPGCWREVPNEAAVCPHCGADILKLHEREYREKLLGALSHPVPDTVIRAATILAARRDSEGVQAIESALRRFADQPVVIAALLEALRLIEDEHARTIARNLLDHPSIIVRRAAAAVAGTVPTDSDG